MEGVDGLYIDRCFRYNKALLTRHDRRPRKNHQPTSKIPLPPPPAPNRSRFLSNSSSFLFKLITHTHTHIYLYNFFFLFFSPNAVKDVSSFNIARWSPSENRPFLFTFLLFTLMTGGGGKLQRPITVIRRWVPHSGEEIACTEL